MKETIVLTGIVLTLMLSKGCTLLPEVSAVKPWEKGLLAESIMAPGGNSADSAIFSHIYTSKETAKGGGGIGGGGCGCN